MFAVLSFSALALFLFAAVPFVLLHLAVRPFLVIPHIVRKRQIIDCDITPLESKTAEHFYVRSFDGYELHCVVIKCAEPKTGRFVVISHGFLENHLYGLRFTDLYLRLNYNVVLYDLRCHGVNKYDYISMGLRESRDLRCLVNELRCRYGKGIAVGLHGQSMGAAASLLALGASAPEEILFCVSDCAYSDFSRLCRHLLLTRLHLPAFYLPLTDLFCRLLYGYSFADVKPAAVLETVDTPVLFIHAASDTLVPPRMSRELYDSAAGYRELELIADAAHAKTFETNPEHYERIISRFLVQVSRQIAVSPTPEKAESAA